MLFCHFFKVIQLIRSKPYEVTQTAKTKQSVWVRVCGSAPPFDLEAWEQHTLEFSDWESRDDCIYH